VNGKDSNSAKLQLFWFLFIFQQLFWFIFVKNYRMQFLIY